MKSRLSTSFLIFIFILMSSCVDTNSLDLGSGNSTDLSSNSSDDGAINGDQDSHDDNTSTNNNSSTITDQLDENCSGDNAKFVSTSGMDSSQCGESNSPCRSIKYAINLAGAGDTVCVRQGTYNENWIGLKSNLWLYSVDGIGQAKIFADDQSAIRLTGISNSGISGFEVYGSLNQGSPGDGMIRVLDATDITIHNVIAHDAPFDQDVIKVSGDVHRLTIDGVIAWNPALRNMSGTYYQEVIDIFGSGGQAGVAPPVSDILVKNCWLFHKDGMGDWLIYSKINTENIIYENNLFGPSAGGGWGNGSVGIGTAEAGIPDSSAAVVTNAIVRNNIFVGAQGDTALAIMNSDNVWVYNNTFHNNSGDSLRSTIMIRGNYHPVGPVHIYNNIFLNNNPTQDTYGGIFWLRGDIPTTFNFDYNLFYNSTSKSDISLAGANQIFGVDPLLENPMSVSTSEINHATKQRIIERFKRSANSPIYNMGLNAMQLNGHPHWRPEVTDNLSNMFGSQRSSLDVWSLGVD